MFKFLRRNKLFFDILACIVFGFGSCMYFIEYFSVEFENSKDAGMKLFGAIVFAVMFLFKLGDSLGGLRKKRVE